MLSFSDQSTIPILLCSVIILTISLKYLLKILRTYYLISKIPDGPKGWPIIGHIFLIVNMTDVKTYFGVLKCGDFMKLWYGPVPLVFISNPDMLQTLFTNPNALHKGWIFRGTTTKLLKESLLRAPVEEWKKNRKICNYAFTPSILYSFLPIFNKISNLLIEEFQDQIDKEEPFDVYASLRKNALDTICATAMGISDLKSLQDLKKIYAEGFEGVVENLSARIIRFWLYPDFIYNRTNRARKENKAMKILWDTAAKIIDDKLEQINNNNIRSTIKNEYAKLDQPIEKNPFKKPLLEFLIDLMQVYPEFTADQLKQEINLFIMAGFETSAITLSYVLVVFGARKDIQQKAYNEVYNIFGDSKRSIELDDLVNMKYLELVIKETLRLYPTIAQITRQTTGDMTLGDYKIPAGTTFFISIMGTHLNPKYWENPMEFIPERFLTTNRHPYAWIPFSSGPRNCIGYKYAMLFMKIQLVNILRNYEIHTDLKLNNLKFKIDMSLRLEDGYLVRLTKRCIKT